MLVLFDSVRTNLFLILQISLFHMPLTCEMCSVKFWGVRFLYLNYIFFRKAKGLLFFSKVVMCYRKQKVVQKD